MFGGDQGGDDFCARGGEEIAVGLGDFLDQAMSVEEAQLAGDGRGLTALFLGVGWRVCCTNSPKFFNNTCIA